MSKLWGITVFFGVSDRERRHENFRCFRKHTAAQGLPLIVVELLFPGQVALLSEDDAEYYVLLKTSSVLWQKERLLNVALQHLPQECEYVAWLDSDLVFLNDQWLPDTVAALEHYKVVQLFDTVYRSPEVFELEELRAPDFAWEQIPFCYARSSGSQLYSLLYILSQGEKRLFTPGYAWAARREILDTAGFYDQAIVGGGDQLIVDAILGYPVRPMFYYDCKHFVPSLKRYAEKLQGLVAGSVSFVPGRIIHLNHGPWAQRKYDERGLCLQRQNCNPESDLRQENGVWEWSTEKQELIEAVREYFIQRGVQSSKERNQRSATE